MRKPSLLASLPATVSPKPLNDGQRVELMLPLWVSLDHLDNGALLQADCQSLLFALRICLLLRQYGVELSRDKLLILNDAVAVLKRLR